MMKLTEHRTAYPAVSAFLDGERPQRGCLVAEEGATGVEMLEKHHHANYELHAMSNAFCKLRIDPQAYIQITGPGWYAL